MRHSPAAAIAILFGAILPSLAGEPGQLQSPAARRTLTFEARVAAQRAIEEVYWRHRIWPKENPQPKPPLSAVIPDEAIRDKVEDYLKKSNALEKYWGRPVNGTQLQAEMERMLRDTNAPDVLQELLVALREDPFLVSECLARPALVDRLARNWYARDERFHGPVKRRAEAVLEGRSLATEMRQLGGEYAEHEWHLGGADRSEAAGISGLPTSPVVELGAEEWQEEVDRLATAFEVSRDAPAAIDPTTIINELPLNRISRLTEQQDGFVVTSVLSKQSDRIRIASVLWRKRPFDAWWQDARTTIDSTGVVADASLAALPAAHLGITSMGSGCVDDTWVPTHTDAPGARYDHTAVWTGSEMIVWGGQGGPVIGSRYDPATDTWRRTSIPPVSLNYRATSATAVWTGTKMIVWGGSFSFGAIYDPQNDSWLRTSSQAGAPIERYFHSAVWTGSRMIIWGGFAAGAPGGPYFNTGGIYDPETDSWVPVGTGPGVPSPRAAHTAVWTGSKMVIWGGRNASSSLASGGVYEPQTNTWLPTSVGAGVPSARADHTAIWTGSEMIVWGGGSSANTGGRYDPDTDQWHPTSTGANVPAGRKLHTAVWTGTEMIVWAGESGSAQTNTGGRYNPLTDSWASSSLASGTGANVPSGRREHTAVWTGSEMIVWGGDPPHPTATGGRYNPSTDSWTPTSTGSGVPTERASHTAVWTGSEMIVWGGAVLDGYGVTDTGGSYDLVTDTWRPTPMGNDTPSPRYYHTAVWTGVEMIVWGGYFNDGVDTGGRYNPITNDWNPTSTSANVPTARFIHTGIWTGTEMVVWGGIDGELTIVFRTGGRYNPSTDSWAASSLTNGSGPNVPAARFFHTAVWTGSEMIVWGGSDQENNLNTGGRYDPQGDSWLPTATGSNVPSARALFTTAWTGSEMIVWGGVDGQGSVNTGGLYEPETDSWRTTSTSTDVPSPRVFHTAVWTGSEMIIWGGFPEDSSQVNTGGRYDPSTDFWAASSLTTGSGPNVPTPRDSHTAVWTGSKMIVWGGTYNGDIYDTGGAYCGQACVAQDWHRDADGDGHGNSGATQSSCTQPPGYVAVAGDCDDDDSVVHPGAPETCNDADDNCDGQVDEGLGTTTCGIGACQRTVDNCVDGTLQTCAPGDPSPEDCNGIDDNCDGRIDEDGATLCDDHNPCTMDSCDSGSGCSHLGEPDSDGDGAADACDQCPASILDPTVIVPPTALHPPPPGTAPNTTLPCDSGVPNLLLSGGCTISDKIAECDASSHNKGQFDKCVKALLNQLKQQHIITEQQRKAIDKCVKKYKKRDVHSLGGSSNTAGAHDF